MGALRQDIRYGLRMFWKNPGFTVVAVMTLAIGIGANTAIFSVVDTVLLRSLPYPEPDQLRVLWDDMKSQKSMVSPGNFLSWKEQSHAFEGMAAYQLIGLTLTGVEQPERLIGMFTSASLFPILGAQAELGRLFATDEDQARCSESSRHQSLILATAVRRQGRCSRKNAHAQWRQLRSNRSDVSFLSVSKPVE